MFLEFSQKANKQIDCIISNKWIYNQYGGFTQQFINWNYEFHRYINPQTIIQSLSKGIGGYIIGSIGTLLYKCYTLDDTDVFEVIEFHFTKLPYPTVKYEIVSDAGYGYKIIQSTFNRLYSIMTPKRARLTKFAFDNIIGFHHSSQNYNVIYAVGFMKDRVYSIFPNGDIKLMPYSKNEYLSMQHKYYESFKSTKHLITERHLRTIIRESIKRILNIT